MPTKSRALSDPAGSDNLPRPRSVLRERRSSDTSAQHEQSFFERYLDPSDRLDELLYGLIMALSITLGVSLAADEGRSLVQIALAILSCNLASGLIDGGMYVVSQLYDRGSKARLVEALRSSNDDATRIATVGSVLDDKLSALTSADERRSLYLAISTRLRDVSVKRTRVAAEDIYGALVKVWLMALASVPAVVPFLLLGDRFLAARTSNGLVLLSLFAVGYGVARSVNANPWAVGVSTTVFGLAMVVIVMLLGG